MLRLPRLHPWLMVTQDEQGRQLSCLVSESSHCCQTTLRKAAGLLSITPVGTHKHDHFQSL